MSKWRPSQKNCIYVIPDIHGAKDLLDKILKRILPLRKSEGAKDRIVFLGDYIDRHEDSHLVIDTLISLKEKYPEQVNFLRGNHEHIFLVGSGLDKNYSDQSNNLAMWLANGGPKTLRGYYNRASLEGQLSFLPEDIVKLIPQSHIDFFKSCEDYFKIDQFTFVHGGFNPFVEIENHTPEFLYWDGPRRNLLNFVKDQLSNNKDLDWEGVVICGHSGPNPIFHPKYRMLDVGSPSRLLVYEVRSNQGLLAEPDKKRLVKFNCNNTVFKKPLFSRAK